MTLLHDLHLGFTRFPSEWAKGYLISCTLCLYLFILVLLCYWHSSICCVLFSREALLQDNTLVTRSRRQAAQLLIVLIVTFFILILPHKIWAIFQQWLNYKQLYQIGFRRHSLIIICTRLLLYLNSAVRLFNQWFKLILACWVSVDLCFYSPSAEKRSSCQLISLSKGADISLRLSCEASKERERIRSLRPVAWWRGHLWFPRSRIPKRLENRRWRGAWLNDEAVR